MADADVVSMHATVTPETMGMMGAEQFVAMGRDVEGRTLTRAVAWHAERRVMLDGYRTVVFS